MGLSGENRLGMESMDARTAMKNLEINLGRACSNRCVFCANGAVSARQRGWMRPADVEAELVAGCKQGMKSVGFIGGEPTLYPPLPQMLDAARRLGFQRIALCTNGIRLAERAFLEQLLENGLTRVTLSVHSHQARLEDLITRRRGAFTEKIKAIQNLVTLTSRLKDGFSLNVVLHKRILKYLVGFLEFFFDLGVRDVRFNFIRPEHDAVGNRSWVASMREVGRPMQELISVNESRLHMHLTFADLPWCRIPWIVLANGDLRSRYIGENLDLSTEVTLYRSAGDGGTKRFNWKNQRTSYLKCLLPSCKDCRLRLRCEGIWNAYLDIYGSEEFADGPGLVEAALANQECDWLARPMGDRE
jgi:MoaA/NifB/PqqE/SkfB family radical SAM enzyme